MITRALAVSAALLGALLTSAANARPTPPDAGAATKALTDSPRHGEWVTLPLDAEGAKDAPTLKVWVSYPERKDKAPVVLVIHEIFGLTDWVRAVADTLAAEGFIAVAPDFLSGMGPGGGGTESFAGDAVREAIRKLTPEEVARRLDTAKAWALTQPAAAEKFGCVGYCWGGSTTFAYATAQPDLDAAVVYYGSAPTDGAALAKIACPVLGQYGGSDARVTATVEPTSKAMAEAGKEYTAHVHDGAGHGFLRQQTGQDGANAKAAEAAWVETIAFFKKNLEAGVGK